MNSPAGFTWVAGMATNIDPWQAMFNPAWKTECIHMVLAAFEATGFAVAGIHAFLLLRRPKAAFHREAFKIALLIGSVAALLQPLSGDRLAKGTAIRQPLKLAAMEAHFKTTSDAALTLGGIPNVTTGQVKYGLEIPNALSFLALESGWMVTEVGRQPWIIYEILKTKDAVTPMPGLIYPFLLFSFVYIFLGFVVVWLLYRHIQTAPQHYTSFDEIESP